MLIACDTTLVEVELLFKVKLRIFRYIEYIISPVYSLRARKLSTAVNQADKGAKVMDYNAQGP